MKEIRTHLRTLLLAAAVAPALPAVAADGDDVSVPALPADTGRVVDIDEAVVVAQPKETVRLRRMPFTSTLFGGEELARRGVTALPDVSAQAPNFFMPSYGSRITSAVYIRGVGSRINTPAVGLYVDNVPFVDKSAYNFSFLGVERVDVLRGPQGTLYGRNAMGGLLRVFTANPLSHRGTDVSLGAETRGGGRRAAFTTYLHPGERTALSLGAFYNGRQGFYRNATTGRKADGSDAAGVRLRQVWRPSERFSLDWNASYEYSDEGACPYFYTGAVPGAEEEYPALVGALTANRGSGYRRGLLNVGLTLERKARAFTFSSVTAFQHLDDRLSMDQDFIRPDIYTLAQSQRIGTLTEELTLKSRPGRWEWTTGAFLLYQSNRTDCPVTFYADGMAFLNSRMDAVFAGLRGKYPQMPPMGLAFTDDGLPFVADMRMPSAGAALFHQSTLNDLFVRGLSLTAGLRLDYDYRELTLASGMEGGRPVAFDFTMAGRPVAHTVTPALDGHLRDDSWQLLPRLALQYEWPARTGNVYVTAAKGYRAGGYNIQAYSELMETMLQREVMLEAMGAMADKLPGIVPDAPDLTALHYRPEQSWNYEAGARLNLLDRRLQADVAVFYMNTKNQQLARFADNGYGRVMVNAGRSRSCGAELGLRASLLDGRLSLSAAYGYTHAVFARHNLGAEADYTGRRVPYVPEHTVAAAADYVHTLERPGAVRTLGAGLGVTGAGRIMWDEANSFSQPFYAQLDASLTVGFARGVTAKLWARNLTATHFTTFAFDSMSRRYAQYGLPRHFGADLTWHF